MHILSVNRGKVAPLFVSESGVTQSVISGIRKQAVDSPVQIGILGMEGDEQADLTVHGGVDKALYLYPYEHYAFWDKTYFDALKKATQLAPGAMGEMVNLFCDKVPVQRRALAGMQRGLGQALLAVALRCRVHQLADLRSVLGDVGSYVCVSRLHHMASLAFSAPCPCRACCRCGACRLGMRAADAGGIVTNAIKQRLCMARGLMAQTGGHGQSLVLDLMR